MQNQRFSDNSALFAKLSTVIWLAGLLLLAGRVPGTHGKSVIGSPRYHNGLLESRESNRRALNDSHILVTGPPVEKTASGSVPIRRDIKDLHDNYPDQFNLYILGLLEFYAVDENDETSFYRIAGIHGRPYGPWSSAEGISGKNAGYCPHSMVLFLTWHRAYLLLYEQLLYDHVSNVANSFIPELRDRYVNAAQDFRIPYWNWAAMVDNDTQPVPSYITNDAQIWVTATDGSAQFVDNPLHHFEFHPCEPVPNSFDGKWQSWIKTLRHPSSDASDAVSRPELLLSHFLELNPSLHNDVGTDMLRNESFNTYSMSHLEMTHNVVHYIAGGGLDSGEDQYWGHMNPLDYSAFDPIFWLHHANVDHIFALYQSLNPTTWLTPANIGASGTFAIADDSTVDASTPLSPFWHPTLPNSFYTSDQLRDTIPLGYAYPETQRWLTANASASAFRDSVRRAVGAAYSPDWRAKMTGAGAEGAAGGRMVRAGRVTAWALRVGAEKGALGGSFSVVVELGGREVGRVAVMVAEGMRVPLGAANRVFVNGTVALTGVLVEEVLAGRFGGLGVQDVKEFLEGEMRVRVDAIVGTKVQVAAARDVGMEVMVVSEEVTVPLDPEMPLVYAGTWVEHPEIVVGGAVGV